MNMSRRAVIAAAIAAGAIGATAIAQERFPSRPIRIIVPFPPGGATDILARELGQKLGQRFNTAVVVENKPGASGQIGTDAVVKAAADGYTLLLTTTHVAIYPALNKKLPYDARKDLVPLGLVASSGLGIAVRADSPYHNLGDLIQAAKKNPGKISFGSTGTGGSTHLSGELLKMKAGIDMMHVPYKGSAPAMTDLLGGHLPVHIDALTGITEYHKTGKIRILAVTSSKRAAALPDVPTVAEASGIKDFQATGWFGVFGPAKLPPEIVSTLGTAISSELASDELKQRIAAQGAEAGTLTQPQFATFFLQELDTWEKVVNAANVKID